MDILPESPVCSIYFPVEDVAGLYAGKLKPGPSRGPVFCAIANRDARSKDRSSFVQKMEFGMRSASLVPRSLSVCANSDPRRGSKNQPFCRYESCLKCRPGSLIDFEKYPTLTMPYPKVTANPAPTFVDL